MVGARRAKDACAARGRKSVPRSLILRSKFWKGEAVGNGREPYDVFLAMRKRRMHREYRPDPVDEALLERLIYAAGRGPSARAGIRHLVVTTDPRLIKSIGQVCPGWLNNAPAMMAVCTDTRLAAETLGASADEATILDSGAAAGYVSLAAPALGLGICFVTSWSTEAVRGVLALPEHIRPDVLLAIGHPIANPPKAAPRFVAHVHRERFQPEVAA
jgi:nitroreductase